MTLIPDIAEFEQRAALCEFESEATREEAEDVAAQEQGFYDADHYWGWLAKYLENRGM